MEGLDQTFRGCHSELCPLWLFSGLLQPLDLSYCADFAGRSLLLRLSLDINDIMFLTTCICILNLTSQPEMAVGPLSFIYEWFTCVYISLHNVGKWGGIALKNSSVVIEKKRLWNFPGFRVSSFDLSTLYRTSPHDLIKDKSVSLLKWCFNIESKTYLCISDKAGVFSNKKYDSYECWSFTEYGTNCALLSPTSFLYSNEADFIKSLLSTGKKHLASRFNLTYRYIDDVLSINNPKFENYLGKMYPAELEIKDTTKSTTFASYIDLLLSIGRDGQLHTSIFDKQDERKRKRSDSVLWQKPLHPQKVQKATRQHKTPPKTSIRQRLRTDLGRSVGVTTATPLVWLTRFWSAELSN